MSELMQNGPIVVSFEPDYNFMMYKSGIYHSIDEKTWISKRLPKPEWEKVDHSVLLVGWGEEEETNEKYWIIQNTWGPSWGEEGFFRMKRGVDEFGIESICEVAEPYVLDRNTNKQMTKKELEEENRNNRNNYSGNYNYNSGMNDNVDSNNNSVINQLDNLDSAMKDVNTNPDTDVFNDDMQGQNSLFNTLN